MALGGTLETVTKSKGKKMQSPESVNVPENLAVVYLEIKKLKGWFQCSDLYDSVGVSERSVRTHVKRLMHLEILEVANTLPAPKYRLFRKKPLPPGWKNALEAYGRK